MLPFLHFLGRGREREKEKQEEKKRKKDRERGKLREAERERVVVGDGGGVSGAGGVGCVGREIVPLLVNEDDQMANSPFNIIYSPRLLGTVRTNRPGAGQSDRTSHVCHTTVQDLDIGF